MHDIFDCAKKKKKKTKKKNKKKSPHEKQGQKNILDIPPPNFPSS